MTFTKADTRKVKGMAIIMMVLHHSFMMPERYKGMNVIFTPFAEEQFNWICWSLKICVAVFTFLSAFGITLSYKQENASSYYQVVFVENPRFFTWYISVRRASVMDIS